MSVLVVMPANEPTRELVRTEEESQIRTLLSEHDVGFERWAATRPLPNNPSPDDVLDAYRDDVDRWMKAGGYQSADVVRLAPDPNDIDAYRERAAAARAKFLEEHTHAEDEVRFFVEGAGLFCMHLQDRVYALLCEQSDFISVPAGTRHWFDMGTKPHFAAIRIFTNEEGWVANFTGDPISALFPNYHSIRESRAVERQS